MQKMFRKIQSISRLSSRSCCSLMAPACWARLND